MTDTSLKNSRGMYCLEQRNLERQHDERMWKYKCMAYDSAFPCVGVNMPMMNNGYNNGVLSNNAADIESALFGIGSTNLVTPKPKVMPRLNNLKNVKFFNRLNTIMPNPLIVEKYQRPIGPYS